MRTPYDVLMAGGILVLGRPRWGKREEWDIDWVLRISETLLGTLPASCWGARRDRRRVGVTSLHLPCIPEWDQKET